MFRDRKHPHRRYSTSNSSHSRRTGTYGSSGPDDFFSDSDVNSEDELEVAPLHLRLLSMAQQTPSRLVPTDDRSRNSRKYDRAGGSTSPMSRSLSNLDAAKLRRKKRSKRSNRKAGSARSVVSGRDSGSRENSLNKRFSSRVSKWHPLILQQKCHKACLFNHGSIALNTTLLLSYAQLGPSRS